MATHDSSKANPDAILVKTPAVCHEYDNWLLPAAKNNADAVFAATVVDVARGVRAIATIVSAHLVDLNAIAGGADDSVRTLLSENDVDALSRLAVHSLNGLYELASNRVDRFNTLADEGASV
jgi:hypothetical protein